MRGGGDKGRGSDLAGERDRRRGLALTHFIHMHIVYEEEEEEEEEE